MNEYANIIKSIITRSDKLLKNILTCFEMDFGNRDTVSWDEVILKETVFPELEDKVKDLIQKRLGYVPRSSIIIAEEPELRILYNQYRFGAIKPDEFYKQSDKHIRHIRNIDMMFEHEIFDYPEIYEKYKLNYLPYLQKAHQRINQCLGYEPPLEYSMSAVIGLSQYFAQDNVILPEGLLTPEDYKAITSIQYRDVFLNHGEVAAINSPLLAMHLID